MEIQPGQQLMGVMQGASAEMQSAAQKIARTQHVKVQQKRQLLEAVSCWEQQNKYVIYDGPDENSNPIYFIQEGSAWWERMCFPPDCKPWRMDYHNIPPTGMPEGTDPKMFPVFMHIERPCSLTCLCINRPEAIITEVPSGRVLGKLRDPWHCYNLTFEIQDPADVTRLTSSTCCCSKGLICPCPGCTVDFPIADAGDQHDVATITKTWMWGDCCPMCFKDWDNNVIHFGETANPDYKMLLITMATFIQLRMFDRRNQQ